MKKYITIVLCLALAGGYALAEETILSGVVQGGGGGTAATVTAVDEFTNSDATNVQDVLDDIDAAIAGGTTVLVDIVTTTPLTVNGGANVDNALPGADADITIAMPAATNASPGHMTAAQVTALEAVDTEAELEALLELQDLQGAVTDAQVPDTITIDLATLATTVTISDDEATNDAQEVVFTTDNANLESDGTLTYNPSTGVVTTTGFAGALTGNVTGDLTGTAALATTVTVSDDEATDDEHEIVFTTDNAALESDGTTTYNPSTGTITATAFAGNMSGATVDITGTTVETTIAADDEVLIYDTSAAANRSMTRGNFVTGIGAGQAITLDIEDDGGNDSTDLGEIATSGDTNSIFTEPSADKLLIDLSADWPKADLADTVTVSDDEATDDGHEVVFTTDNAAMESDGDLTYNPSSGTLTSTAFAGDLTGGVTGNVTGNVSGTAATVTGAAQANITSLGTLTTLTVDNLTVNGNTVTADSGALNLTPATGSAIVLDGAVNVDAGVVTGATSITSTAFVGDLTGTASDVGTDSIAALTDIVAGLKSGSDADLITGTAGTATYTAVWNADGDLVVGSDPAAIDPDNLSGDTTDNNLVDQAVIEGLAGASDPFLGFRDTDAVGAADADEEAGRVYANMITATEDAEDSDMWFTVMQGGARTTVLLFDESDDQWETTKNFVVPTEVYDATNWNGDNTIPTKDAIRDKIEGLAGTGTMTTVEDGDSGVGGADIVTLDFDGTVFNITESPDTEINIDITDDGLDSEHYNSASIDPEHVSSGAWDFGTSVRGDTVISDGDLTLTGLDITADGTEEVISIVDVATAVNEITVTNAAAGNSPSITTTGGDAAVGLGIDSKGAGEIIIGSADAKFSVVSDAIDISNTGDISNAGTIGSGAITSTGLVTGDSLSTTEFTVSDAGAVVAVSTTSPTVITDLIDTTGAADLDIGSADILDITFLTDGDYVFTPPADTDTTMTFTGTTASGVLLWMEDEDYFQFSDKVVFDLDIDVGNDVLLADGAVIGITGNEVMTFNAAGSINVTGATMDVDGAFTATSVVTDGALQAQGAFTSLGIDDNADATAITIDVTSENVTLSSTTEASAIGTAALVASGGLGVAFDAWIGDDLTLDSDGAIISLGADQDVTLTHVADTSVQLNVALDITGSGGLILENDETITNSTDGTVAISGALSAKPAFQTDAAGAITIEVNAVNYGTDTGDADIPDGACDAAGDVGNWVVLISDAADQYSLTSDDASNVFVLDDLTALTAGDELDVDGSMVSVMCVAAETWKVTGYIDTAPTDGGIAD